MTPEQLRHIDADVYALFFLGAVTLIVLAVMAERVLDKLNQILERMGPKP